MRYIGIDYGTKRVGIAFSDEAGTMGFPYGILPNTVHLEKELIVLLQKEKVDGIVIGESKNFSGGENPVAQAARALGEKLSETLDLPVHFESEIFTTQEAKRFPTGERSTSHEAVDASAAALILTSFLSHNI